MLIYEELCRRCARSKVLRKIGPYVGSTLEEQIWNFDVLGIREVRDLAAGAARKADIVIVSLSGRTELAHTIWGWLNMWLWLLEEENPALVALFESSARQKTAPVAPIWEALLNVVKSLFSKTRSISGCAAVVRSWFSFRRNLH